MSAVHGRLPVWERLRAPDHRPLVMRPLRSIEVEELLVDDGDLPGLGGATVFDAWPTATGVTLRAATIEDITLQPLLVHAARLHIERSDGRLEALLAGSGPIASPGDLEHLGCACRGISADAVYRALGRGWTSAEAVKRSTRLAFGVCQGRRCLPWLAERVERPADDPRTQIRPRPPLVPVPASLLAAYA